VPAFSDHLVELACGYPYSRLTRSVVFVDGEVHPYTEFDAVDPWEGTVGLDGAKATAREVVRELAGCEVTPAIDLVPVIAYGSNASPAALRRKFASCDGPVAFPVLVAELRGFDVVYSAHFTSYGALPATLVASPGTSVRLALMLLPRELLAHLNGGEAIGVNYRLERLDGIDLRVARGARRRSALAYRSLWGPLIHDGRPLALAAAPASGRCFPAVDETEALLRTARRLAPRLGLERLVHQAVEDPLRRMAWTCKLAAHNNRWR
jgi:hypothetical protein